MKPGPGGPGPAGSLTGVSDAVTPDLADEADDLPEQMRVRREKRQRILDAGGEASPVEVPRTHSLK